jgi:hypothetical protein
MAVNNITQERLKELLHYDPDTGVFIWIKKSSPKTLIGSAAGSLSKEGYWRIMIDGKSHKTHRLAWLYVYGEFPNGILDHINRDKADNRISNLRIVTFSENNQNSKIYKNNTSGVTGVYWHKVQQKWKACVRISRKLKHLGSFITMEEAIAARRLAEKEFYSLPD